MREVAAKLTEGEKETNLSPSQKSNIFDSPLVRGGRSCVKVKITPQHMGVCQIYTRFFSKIFQPHAVVRG